MQSTLVQVPLGMANKSDEIELQIQSVNDQLTKELTDKDEKNLASFKNKVHAHSRWDQSQLVFVNSRRINFSII